MLFFFLLIIYQITLWSCSASATPLLSFPLTKVDIRAATLGGSYDTISTLKRRGLTNGPVTNLNYSQYVMDIGVGDPPTYYSLMIDTGSSVTFVGYVKFNYVVEVSTR